MKVETRELLAESASGYVRRGHFLSHAVEIDAEGREVRVLCGRVKLDNVADHYAQPTDVPPTCRLCAKRDPRQEGA